MVEALLQRVAAGEALSLEESNDVILAIIGGHVEDPAIAAYLTALHQRGVTVDEVAGAAMAVRRHMTAIPTRRAGVLDTCGTGGDSSGTFNISTGAALVAAAAGVPVAKHGNRSVTSRTGSADVLSALGVNIEAPPSCVSACLDELGICFCFAPVLHSSMKRVAAVRKKLKFPTIFNLLGPLTNPAHAPYQLLGAGRAEVQPILAEALLKLGTERALVVRGDDGLDEVTLFAPTQVIELSEGRQRQFTWNPSDFGFANDRPRSDREPLLVDGPAGSASVIRRVLAGHHGPARDVVVINAAAAIWIANLYVDPLQTPASAAQKAADAIDSGAAERLLRRLAERTNNF